MISLIECSVFRFFLSDVFWGSGGGGKWGRRGGGVEVGYSMIYHILCHILFDCCRIPSHRGTAERGCSTLRGFRN